ncbi:hypothetical protein [Neptunicella sp.]|uniref:hypothetical protein n=1 Tax=Neptunicella sp. TaxID=2125986 RepID=UPI003F6916B4
MTSDGISSKDWEGIEGLASFITELSAKDSSTELYDRKLIKRLDDLEEKYGRLPSILATKADYVCSSKESLILLKEAYVAALEISDVKNLSYVSSSIAEFYAEGFERQKLDFWIEKLQVHSLAYKDDYIEDSLEELMLERTKME